LFSRFGSAGVPMWNHTVRHVASSICWKDRRGYDGFIVRGANPSGCTELHHDKDMTLLVRDEMKVLIVDDNNGIRRMLRRILDGTADVIWECTDGSQALAAYEEHRPDFVLMDVRMPIVDGLTATREICSHHPDARIIVVTDYEDEDVKAAALEAGACEYVLKHEMGNLPEVIDSLSGSGKA
jgi:CheY-like chemotaxis protein